ncbi:MAG: USH1C-binding protein 1, partial [Candidatus Accumulibacter sp.]|nr:USH1C-binding protein 1 [Accumulibacter sp.]
MVIPTQAQLDAARSSGISSVGTIDVNNIGSSSLQLMFAKFQLALSESAKQSAMGYINDMQKTQEEQKKVAQLLNEARQKQADAKASGSTTAMSADMKAYMDTNSLAYDRAGNDLYHTKDEWDVAIKSLQARSEALGTDTQQ